MSDQEVLESLKKQEEKIDAIYKSVEKTRKYFLWILVITIAAIVIPAIGLMFAIPKFISTYLDLLNI